MAKWTAPVQRGPRGPGLSTGDQAAIDAVKSAARSVDTIGDREAIPVASRVYGLQIYVVEEARTFVWLPNDPDDPDNDPGQYAGNEWVPHKSEAERDNIENIPNGRLNQDRINGLGSALSSIDASLARIDFVRLAATSFTATPSQAETGDTIARVQFAMAYAGGVPNGAVIERSDGQRLWWLKGGETTADTNNAPSAPAGLLVVGDSQSFEKWETAFATALGLTLVRCALYSQTSRKQALRVGAYPLNLTLASNTLPAAGTQGTVTLVNGAATVFSNLDAVLHASNPDTTTHTISGVLTVSGGTRHVTLTHAAGTAPDVYKIEQDAGGGSVAVAAGALFVPDYKAMLMGTHRVTIMVGHNSMSGSDPVGAFAGIDAIMALRGRNIVQLFAIFPGDTETALIPHIVAFNQWMRDKYPGAFALDAASRDLYQRLLASGNPTGQDATDRAAGRIPTSLQADDLHLNSAGNTVWTTYAGEDNSLHFAGIVPLTSAASFTYRARGAVPGYPAIEVQATITVPFLHRRFWGVNSATTLNSAGVVALGGSDLGSGRAKAATVSAADQYVWVAYPASLGDPSSYRLFGFDETPVKTTVSVTKSNGAVVSYTILRSPLKLTGSVPVEVQ